MSAVRRLYLLRHAKSDWGDTSLPDFDRPLAPRGRKACKRLATYVESEGVAPELVLCSPALRARQTLERVARALGEPEVVFDDSLYMASGERLAARIADVAPTVASVMLVAHNPGISQLLRMLHGGGLDAPADVPTGALATLAFPGADWRALAPGACGLEALVLPRELPD